MDDFFNEQPVEESGIDIARFVQGMLKRWWLIGAITLAVFLPWAYYVKKQPPVYKAEAWISFENVTSSAPEIESRKKKLESRSFAEEVTAELGLTLDLEQEEDKDPLERTDVFTLFSTTKDPLPGTYTLSFTTPGLCTIIHGGEYVESIPVERCIQDTITLNGISFSLHPQLSENRNKVRFKVKAFQSTVTSLIAKENISSNRAGNLMKIALKDEDPVLASQTVNMLAQLYIKKSLDIRREARQFRKNYLEDQLNMVRKELNSSDYQMKSFRSSNIVGLSQQTQEAVDRLTRLETALRQLELQRNELKLLVEKLDPSTSEFEPGIDLVYIYQQIANHPLFENDADMNIAKQQYLDLGEQRREMLKTLPRENPNIIDLSEQLDLVMDDIYRLGLAKLKKSQNDIEDFKSRIASQQSKLDRLPSEELRYTTLDRERRVNEELYTLLNKQVKEAQISEAVQSEIINIIDPAIPPRSPISGDKRNKSLFGFVAGLFLGILVVFILEVADKSIKSSDDVTRYLKMPVLGIIPNVKFDTYELQDSEKAKSISSQIVTHDYSPTPVGEAYRSLRTSLLFSKSIGPLRSFVVASVSPGEGKSFTAANLAITLAQQKSKTLLIDADLRRGVIHNTFACAKKPGLTNYLTGVTKIEDVLQETYVPNLSIITCGSLIPNPTELLGSLNMKRFLERVSKAYDFVIFDTPPLFAATDAVILGSLVDGVAVLIRSGKTNRDLVRRKMELFENVQANVIGVILNGSGVEVAHEGYSYYSY